MVTSDGTPFWEVFTAIATAVGGIGAMISAIFSAVSSGRSAQAARDLQDALAAAIRPNVGIGNIFSARPGGRVTVTNSTPHLARDVMVEVTTRDGVHLAAVFDEVHDEVMGEFREVATGPPPMGLRLTYSDERRLAGYRYVGADPGPKPRRPEQGPIDPRYLEFRIDRVQGRLERYYGPPTPPR